MEILLKFINFGQNWNYLSIFVKNRNFAQKLKSWSTESIFCRKSKFEQKSKLCVNIWPKKNFLKNLTFSFFLIEYQKFWRQTFFFDLVKFYINSKINVIFWYFWKKKKSTFFGVFWAKIIYVRFLVNQRFKKSDL